MNYLKACIKVLITAGPTREPIDPVRYLTNRSSGKMGYAIAEVFLKIGFEVILISGPVELSLYHSRLRLIKVGSAQEMYNAAQQYFEATEIAVFTAAVADYRPAEIAEYKLQKKEDSFQLQMVKNIDIAFEFGLRKTKNQIAIGFALETDHELDNAVKKIWAKNLDLVILNSTQDEFATFGYDTNKIAMIYPDASIVNFPLKPKIQVAKDIVMAAINLKAQKV
ncbi:phosphopantothenoylcysteine decarboxylase [Pedobacter sp. PAMC26386]|nr:phosphopantothenoylcysteine decarboxylase [Pedobacter sp. PAMC26386]